MNPIVEEMLRPKFKNADNFKKHENLTEGKLKILAEMFNFKVREEFTWSDELENIIQDISRTCFDMTGRSEVSPHTMRSRIFEGVSKIPTNQLANYIFAISSIIYHDEDRFRSKMTEEAEWFEFAVEIFGLGYKRATEQFIEHMKSESKEKVTA